MGQHIIIVGLGFGDEGKGSLTDFLCREHQVGHIVRFNGGAQAAHNVVLPDGRHHTFAQFGSGTFAGAKTYLSEHMLVNPLYLEPERKHLEELGVETDGLVTIHEDALVTTPFHVAANRLMELQRTKRHGSCGMGIGETMLRHQANPEQSVYIRNFFKIDVLVEKLEFLQKHYCRMFEMLVAEPDEASARELAVLQDPGMIEYCIECFYGSFTQNYEVVNSSYLQGLVRSENLVFEGAQGALLDENYGFSPYTTWSTTTVYNALKLLYNGEPKKIRSIGVTRAYHTRHGEGPFPTEDVRLLYPDHNCEGPWQGNFRFGSLDLVLLRYARIASCCTEIAVTCLDHVPEEDLEDNLQLRVCVDYAENVQDGWPHHLLDNARDPESDKFARLVEGCKPVWEYAHSRIGVIHRIQNATGLPVTIISEGPTHQDKRWL